MLEKTLVVGPFQCNCRLLACERTGEALLIDPGDEPKKIIRAVESLKTPAGQPLKVRALFHSHAHLDHIAGTRGVREALTERPPIYLHRADEKIYQALQMQAEMFGLRYDDPLPIDSYFEDNQEIRIGDLRFTILHTPGHSPGGVSIRLHEDSQAKIPELLFSGDTLFYRSVGRTDLWGGDQDEMFRNIRERIFTLDDDTRVCPGHGPDTRVGEEKRENPFLT